MKKLVFTLVAISGLFSMAACGESEYEKKYKRTFEKSVELYMSIGFTERQARMQTKYDMDVGKLRPGMYDSPF